MTIVHRIEKLERVAPGAGGDPGEPPPIILTWPDEKPSPEVRAQNAAARAWYAKHGWPGGEITLLWPDGSEVEGP